jgi:hypothetical protein
LQALIEKFVSWNEDIGEWQLKCVAYTGNNMRKQVPINESTHENDVTLFVYWSINPVTKQNFWQLQLIEPNLSSLYLSYSTDRVTHDRELVGSAKKRCAKSAVSRSSQHAVGKQETFISASTPVASSSGARPKTSRR